MKHVQQRIVFLNFGQGVVLGGCTADRSGEAASQRKGIRPAQRCSSDGAWPSTSNQSHAGATQNTKNLPVIYTNINIYIYVYRCAWVWHADPIRTIPTRIVLRKYICDLLKHLQQQMVF